MVGYLRNRLNIIIFFFYRIELIVRGKRKFMILEYKVTESDKDLTIKDILKKKLHISNRLITKLKLNHRIYINHKEAMVNEIASKNSEITINLDFIEEDNILPQKGDLEILYEDEYLLAVNKPSNLVVHPCSYHLENTLANYVKDYLKNQKRIRPINRLDNGTSGIVLFAKNEYMQELFKNLKEKPIKEYIAIAYGIFEKKEGILSFPIARKPDSIIEREVNFEIGQRAVTHYKVLKECMFENVNISIVSLFLETGRTHQIRVHMSYAGHPLIGDTLYTKENICPKEVEEKINCLFPSQALHAFKLTFQHPIKQKDIVIVAPIPEEINKFLTS